MKILIRGGEVVTADARRKADVLVDGETIAAVGEDLAARADRVLDARGQYVLPGGVDAHTHFELAFGGVVSSDDFETGTIAALHGGTTTVIDFAVPEPGATLRSGYEAWRAKADGRTAVDYGLHVILRDGSEARLAEMDELVREGVTSFKLFMAYPGVYLLDDGAIFRALQRARANGSLITVHAENGHVIEELRRQALAAGRTEPIHHALTRPPQTEGEATGRAILLAELAGAPVYIVHLTAAPALAHVREARARGLRAYAETCPQYLFLTEDCYREPGFDGAKYVMSPPLRPRGHQEELWRGLADGTLQVVGTDHCPFCMHAGFAGLPAQKERGIGDFTKIPNGVPGVETRLVLLHDGGVRAGRFPLERLVDICCTAPARIFGLYPRKGTIAVGSDADLVVFDPNRRLSLSAAALHMRVDYSPYEGREVTGAPSAVLARGEVVVEDGKYLGRKGRGRFLRRGAPMV
jgi:dihydropyrimidinase